jgi:hypothetical protein
MLETTEAMSLRTIMEIVGPMVLAVALIYGTVQWSSRRRGRIDAIRESATCSLYRKGAKDERLENDPVPADVGADAQTADKTPNPRLPDPRMPNPRIAGRLRSGRQGNRPSEDDIVQLHMGPRGLPGEPARANVLGESETQIPKALDPGHTA